MNKFYVVSGAIGAITVILVLIAISIFWQPFNYRPIYIEKAEMLTKDNDSVVCGNGSINYIEDLKHLKERGVVLTPNEYVSQVTSYYNTLVAFLIGLFVLFTLASIFNIKITSKREIEEAKQELIEKEASIKSSIKQSIGEELKEVLRDSISFRDTVISALMGSLEDKIVTEEEIDEIENNLSIISGKIDKLREDHDFILQMIDHDIDKKEGEEEIL